MTEQELRELVRETIREVLADLTRPRRGLVLFTGALLGFDPAAAAVARLKAAGWDLNMVLTQSARHVLDPQRVADLDLAELRENLVRDHEVLIIPTLTVNIAAKASACVADCLASNLIHQFLLQGRPVVAVRVAACPDNVEKKSWFPTISPGLAHRMRQNLTELEAMGVTLCDAETLDRAAEQARLCARVHLPDSGNPPGARYEQETLALTERVVTHGVIAALPEGTTVRLPNRPVVTDLARDLARSRGITFLRNTEGD